jgi:hypothetical protein
MDEIKKNDDMNVYDKYDNLNKGIEGAKKVGVPSETNADDVLDKNKERDNDLLGDILARINVPKNVIKENKDTEKLCNEGETVDDVANLPVDDFLKRWFNQHLKNAEYPNEVTNFSDDLKDSEKYTILLNDLSPECDKSALDNENLDERAQKVIDDGKKYGADTEIKPEDITSANEPLNRLFVGDLYKAELANQGGNDYDKDLMKTYIQTMNKCLCDDEDTKNKIPIDPESEEEVFDKLKDGIVLAKLESLADRNKVNEDELKKGDEITDEDKTNNVKNVLDAVDKLGVPTKLKPADVLTGKKLAEEVFGDFIDMINIFKEYKEFLNNENYDFWSVQDFVDFYSQISLGITDDEYFENLMKNVWNLNENNYYNDNNYYNNEINNQRIKTGTVIMNGRY